jgi:hypothetical protein
MSGRDDLPRFVPNYFPPVLPALYALQVHGWGTGVSVYLGVFFTLVIIGWTFILSGWSFRWLARARIAVIAVSVIAVGISAMEV